MAEESIHIAVDLGAGSGRVVLGRVGRELSLQELHRFANPMEKREGHLRWNPSHLMREIVEGIGIARETLVAGSVSSAGADSTGERGVGPGLVQDAISTPALVTIGVDTWGVDYCLLDASHELIEDPICYRDPRTEHVVSEVLSVIDIDRLYDKTGIQLLHFNTLFQLWTHVRSGNWPEEVAAICLMPDLFHLWLSGRRITEYTQATTSQMVQVQDRDWDPEILSLIGLREGCLPRPTPPGTRLGIIREEIPGGSTEAVEAADIEVVVPASHDTASAIVGTPLADGWAYISCGTWALIGLELSEPELGPLARRYQFSNEGGFENTITFLKNVSGMWILDSCLEVWRAEGRVGGHEELLAGLGDAVPGGSLLDPDAPCFMGISNMPQTVLGFLHDTGQVVPEDPAEIARTILDSLAIRFAAIIAQLGEATGTAIPGIHIVGGGSQNEYLMQATANATRLPVVAGPVEATALGNVLVQAIGVGTLPDLAEARRWVRDQVTLRTFSPGHEAEWAEARAAFEALTS